MVSTLLGLSLGLEGTFAGGGQCKLSVFIQKQESLSRGQQIRLGEPSLSHCDLTGTEIYRGLKGGSRPATGSINHISKPHCPTVRHLHLAIVPLLRYGCLRTLLGEMQHPTACIIGRRIEQQVVISLDGCGDIQLVSRLVDVLLQHFTR